MKSLVLSVSPFSFVKFSKIKLEKPSPRNLFCVCNVSFYFFMFSGFLGHQAVGRTAGNILIRLADSLVLPLNCSDYAESLEGYLNTAVSLYEEELKARNISMGKHRTKMWCRGIFGTQCKCILSWFYVSVCQDKTSALQMWPECCIFYYFYSCASIFHQNS